MVDTKIFQGSPSDAAILERAWVARCRAGDKDAMGMIVEKHRYRLVRAATNLLRDRHEAEDISQDAFIKAFRELGKLRDDRAFSGYLYRICVRLCMDRLRARRPEVAEFDAPQASAGREVENRVVVERLLNQLPYDLKTTLILREMEQLSYEEVAEVMSIPVGTVRSRLHTARERFRKLWLEAVGDPS